ncbi:hypothetical protein [Bordetella holmesii]|uniref:hypothetical protein n=1 Tax=Bordetella holmesii TaxID=35814 RepID=UPI00045B4EDB|nr:hypothetical protein [Bordetella holmesii]AMD44351.1 hypothetical protein H558_01895 [Bordetella holmesii H558]AMD50702.1 hypothetical protein F783_016180 [Bordetella holmesii F627]AOB36462.1 hypothetical protein BBB42_13710 [Bordetella holmesii]KAK90062.1 hypothetical protein L573_3396 [Bordetella holmesii H620]KAK91221.1 hypothetical protein L499_A2124 [Bordetella holmesii CDC-H635-BH]
MAQRSQTGLADALTRAGSAEVAAQMDVRRPLQAQVFTQRLAWIGATEDAAPFQFRQNVGDHIAQAVDQARLDQGKTVRGFGLQSRSLPGY